MIDLEPRLLRAFLAIHDLRNVSAAGRRLGVTQPTMSGHLKRLRAHFMDPLFVPAKGGLRSTAKADEIREIAAEIVNGLARLAATSSEWSCRSSERRFRVMASGYVQTIVSTRLDDAVRRTAPLVGIEFVQPHCLENLSTCDAYILPAELTPSRHDGIALFRDRLTCLASRKVLPEPKALTLGLFCQLKHVLLAPAPSPPHEAVDAALAQCGRTRRVGRISSELGEVRRLLAHSQRLAMLPSRLARDMGDEWVTADPPIRLEPIDFILSWPDVVDEDTGRAWFRRTIACALVDT